VSHDYPGELRDHDDSTHKHVGRMPDDIRAYLLAQGFTLRLPQQRKATTQTTDREQSK
jgi:hypothetical protein